MTDTTGRRERRDPFAFDRSDRWGLVALLGLVAVAAVLAWVVAPVRAWVDGTGIPIAMLSDVSVPQLDAAGVDHGLAVYEVRLDDPTTGQRLLAMSPGLLSAVLLLVGCWLVVRVMRDISAGDPFQPRNVTRLRVVAAILLIGAPVVFFLDLPVSGALLASMDLGGLEPAAYLSIPWPAFVAGMVVALFAEAFRAGSRLRDDVDGLV